MKHYVYKITNIKENKHYIGVRSAKNPYKDLGIEYFSSSSDKEFMLEQQEFPERFEYNILEVFSTRKDAINKEIELHNLYDVAVNESFYNKSKQTSIGFCRVGTTFNHTKETKEKLSLAHIGKILSQEHITNIILSKTGEKNPNWGIPRTEETKERIRLSNIGDNSYWFGKTGKDAPYYGRTHSEETRAQISAALTGKPLTEDHKRKISDSLKGRVFSEETKRKMSLAQSGKNNPNFGKTTSEETKEKISISGKLAQQKRYIENARRFIIHDAEGNLIHDELISSFVRFCTDNNYPKGSFREAHKTNEPVKGGKFKGWTVRRTNQQSKEA